MKECADQAVESLPNKALAVISRLARNDALAYVAPVLSRVVPENRFFFLGISVRTL